MRLSTLCLLSAAAFLCSQGHAQTLLENGNFDDPTNPLKGWITDYEWSGNTHYIANKKFVSVVSDGNRKTVVKMNSPGVGGVKMESKLFPLEPGFRYTCNLDLKGGPYRIYFAGYRWAPGIRPHENPELAELRMVYQSKATTGRAQGWKREKLEIPGVTLSPDALAHLKEVRFLTLYIYFLEPGFVDDASITKTPDPSIKF